MEVTVDYKVFEKGKLAPKYSVKSDLDGRVSLEDFLIFAKKTLISISLNALQEEQAKGFPKNPVVVTDGKTTKNIADVSPLGKIFFVAQVTLDKVLLDTYQAIVGRQIAKDTGTYASAHFVMLNKTVIAGNLSELQKFVRSSPVLKDGDTIRFVNLTPYAGKLERDGRSGNKFATTKYRKSTDKKRRSGEIVRRPNGAYFLASRVIGAKYKFNLPVRFEFIPGNFLDFSRAPKRAPGQSKDFRKTFSKDNYKYKGTYVYPSIRMIVRGGGLVS